MTIICLAGMLRKVGEISQLDYLWHLPKNCHTLYTMGGS